MTRNVWRAAMAVGLLAWAGSATAGNPVLVISPEPVAPATPHDGVITPVGGCSSCPAGGSSHGKGLGFRIGEGCPNTPNCGTCATERTFLFGSCRQFFNPGSDCGGPLAGCFRGPTTIYGPGGLGSHSNCAYSSFNDR